MQPRKDTDESEDIEMEDKNNISNKTSSVDDDNIVMTNENKSVMDDSDGYSNSIVDYKKENDKHTTDYTLSSTMHHVFPNIQIPQNLQNIFIA